MCVPVCVLSNYCSVLLSDMVCVFCGVFAYQSTPCDLLCVCVVAKRHTLYIAITLGHVNVN